MMRSGSVAGFPAVAFLGEIDALVARHQLDVSADGHPGSALHHHPMFRPLLCICRLRRLPGDTSICLTL